MNNDIARRSEARVRAAAIARALFVSAVATLPLFAPPPARASTLNACTIVTRADLERIVGHIESIGKPISVANPPGSQGCLIAGPGGSIILAVRPTPNAAKFVTDFVKRPQNHAQPDTAGGQPAAYVAEVKMFATGKGGTYVSVMGLSRDKARQVLSAAVKRL